jgi:hypothetical protein
MQKSTLQYAGNFRPSTSTVAARLHVAFTLFTLRNGWWGQCSIVAGLSISMEESTSCKSTVSQLVKKFPAKNQNQYLSKHN